MIVSNEPGYYEDGEFGVRIENLLIVTPIEVPHNFKDTKFYGFETLTFVPIQTKCIATELLTQKEIEYLNGYHQKVKERVLPYLEGSVKDWVIENTKPISQ